MRAMRVVAFVVYFKSGLFSGKKKNLEIFTWKNDVGCVMLGHFTGGW